MELFFFGSGAWRTSSSLLERLEESREQVPATLQIVAVTPLDDDDGARSVGC